MALFIHGFVPSIHSSKMNMTPSWKTGRGRLFHSRRTGKPSRASGYLILNQPTKEQRQGTRPDLLLVHNFTESTILQHILRSWNSIQSASYFPLLQLRAALSKKKEILDKSRWTNCIERSDSASAWSSRYLSCTRLSYKNRGKRGERRRGEEWGFAI